MVITTDLQVREASPDAPWDHQAIKAEVWRRGSSFRRLSIKAGLAPSTVQASLYKRHPRANLVIAEFLGVPCHELWPAWYEAGKSAGRRQGGFKARAA